MTNLEKELAAHEWQLVDNSGDGGDFGFYMKSLLNGKFIIGMSTGGEKPGDDFLYPAIKDNDVVSIVIMYKNDGQSLPTNPDDFMRSDSLAEWNHEMIFNDPYAAIDYVTWLEDNIK